MELEGLDGEVKAIARRVTEMHETNDHSKRVARIRVETNKGETRCCVANRDIYYVPNKGTTVRMSESVVNIGIPDIDLQIINGYCARHRGHIGPTSGHA